MELAWIREGHLAYRTGSKHHVASPGSIVLVPKEHEHQNTFLGSLRGGAISVPDWLEEDAALALFGTRDATIRDTVVIPNVARLATIGDAILDAMRVPSAASQEIAESLAEGLILAATRAAAQGRPTRGPGRGLIDERIVRARQAMRERIAEPVSIDELAKEAKMSRFHFARLFRSQVGKAPYAYLIDLRLERASRLLSREGGSVASAALDSGFGDLGRFATMFRRRYGMSPSEFRRRAFSS